MPKEENEIPAQKDAPLGQSLGQETSPDGKNKLFKKFSSLLNNPRTKLGMAVVFAVGAGLTATGFGAAVGLPLMVVSSVGLATREIINNKDKLSKINPQNFINYAKKNPFTALAATGAVITIAIIGGTPALIGLAGGVLATKAVGEDAVKFVKSFSRNNRSAERSTQEIGKGKGERMKNSLRVGMKYIKRGSVSLLSTLAPSKADFKTGIQDGFNSLAKPGNAPSIERSAQEAEKDEKKNNKAREVMKYVKRGSVSALSTIISPLAPSKADLKTGIQDGLSGLAKPETAEKKDRLVENIAYKYVGLINNMAQFGKYDAAQTHSENIIPVALENFPDYKTITNERNGMKTIKERKYQITRGEDGQYKAHAASQEFLERIKPKQLSKSRSQGSGSGRK